MTVKEKLKYMLNVPEDYGTMDIASFLNEHFGMYDDILDYKEILEKEIEESC